MLGEILAAVIATAAAFGAVGDAYEKACETAWGGTYVNDNPSFYQSYSCVGGTRPDKG